MTPEQEQAEEDAALARAEHDHEEARDRAREELHTLLAAGCAVELEGRECLLLVEWIGDLRRRVEAQQYVLDSITAERDGAPF